MGTPIEKPGGFGREILYEEKQTDSRGRYIPGKKTSVYSYTFKRGRMYPVRVRWVGGKFYIEFDPRDIRNTAGQTGQSITMSSSSQSTTAIGQEEVCEGGAVCCADISCSNSGGCGFSFTSTVDYFCNPFCQSYYDSYGENPDGCPTPYDSECQTCNELSNTITERFYEGMHCRCARSKPGDCQACNYATGFYYRHSACNKKEEPDPEGADTCVCYSTYCQKSYTLYDTYTGEENPPPADEGYIYTGFATDGGEIFYFYCSLPSDPDNEIVCTDKVTGELCCPKDSDDPCICDEQEDGTVKCYRACDPNNECNAHEDEQPCPNGNSDCAECEVCDLKPGENYNICQPDPSCGDGCGSVGKPCECHEDCAVCDICNENGRCIPDNTGCTSCVPNP